MKSKIRLLLFFPLVIAVGVGTTVGLLFAQFEGLPEVHDLERYRPSTITRIYDYYRAILEMASQGWPGGLRWLRSEDSASESIQVRQTGGSL